MATGPPRFLATMRQCYPMCLVCRARDDRANQQSRAQTRDVPAASYVVARAQPHQVPDNTAMWAFDPSETAEQTLIRDFNRNNTMLRRNTYCSVG